MVESSADIPKLKRVELFDRVAELNRPIVEDALDNPLAGPYLFIRTENPGLAQWGGYVADQLNQGLGGDADNITIERRVFENSFIAAYDLISRGYNQRALELPTIATPPDWYGWLGFEAAPTLGDLFAKYNVRQREALDEYYDYFEALQTWGNERMGFTTRRRVGMTAIAGAEVYLSFRDHQEPKF